MRKLEADRFSSTSGQSDDDIATGENSRDCFQLSWAEGAMAKLLLKKNAKVRMVRHGRSTAREREEKRPTENSREVKSDRYESSAEGAMCPLYWIHAIIPY